MGNDGWLEAYPKANALFLPESISDHSPAILRVDSCTGGGHKPFKYFRIWSSAEDFSERIANAWMWSGTGTNIRGFYELQAGVSKALMQLTEAQTKLQQRPLDKDLIMAEKTAAKEYQERNKVYMQFLRQKAKCRWITDGDENTALFHQSIKQRRLQNNIYVIKNGQGVLVEDQEKVATAFVEYYKSLLEEVEGMKYYKVSKVYQKIVDDKPAVDRARSVWSRGNVPKHRFCWWVAAHGRLPTADRLVKMGTAIDQGCVLCSEAEESHQHLFFKCKYTQDRLSILREWLRSNSKADNWKSMVRWINRRGQNAKAQRTVWNAMIAALIYMIWQARNSGRQGRELQECTQQIAFIKFQVRQRACMIGREKLSKKEKEWLDCIFDC
ncbi:Peptide chain release factor 1 [Bienertia sinuspersici]